MKVTFVNARRTNTFFALNIGEVFMDDEDNVFIKGGPSSYEEFALNLETGETCDFDDNELVYPLSDVELVIK